MTYREMAITLKNNPDYTDRNIVLADTSVFPAFANIEATDYDNILIQETIDNLWEEYYGL